MFTQDFSPTVVKTQAKPQPVPTLAFVQGEWRAFQNGMLSSLLGHTESQRERTRLDWVIVGGESGPGARPFNLAWALDLVEQSQGAGVACFVKQLGSFPVVDYYADDDLRDWALDQRHSILVPVPGGYAQHTLPYDGQPPPSALLSVHLGKRKGGDIEEFPEVLKVRDYPEVRTPA